MKTLRGKIFLFVSLLIILPSLPLSYFVLQLLEKSYRIGVNERVESALEGSLEISTDLYQMHKSTLQSLLKNFVNKKDISTDQITAKIKNTFKEANSKISLLDEFDYQKALVPSQAIKRFLKEGKKIIVWPDPNHKTLYALTLLNENRVLQIVYPLPESFQNSASQIQEVNQIYKTLSFVRKEIRTSFLYTFLTIYSLGLLVTLFVLFKISKKITNPIKLLTAATKEIGKGNLSYQINISGQDEFALLASSFNRMVGELSENQKKIIELEKMATWQQLARRLAHEIKNPLTPIQLMAQQMRDSYTESDASYKETINECYEIIEEEVESLKRLVREFSDFARLPEFRIENQTIQPLIDTIAKLYRQANIKVEMPGQKIYLKYDSEYMKRALINIVDNAIAACDAENQILIKITEEQKTIEIKLTDRGQGIKPENLTKIFEPYFSNKRSGVGLGLPIVKKIVEEHGGKINVKSVVGKGTTVTIILPKLSKVDDRQLEIGD